MEEWMAFADTFSLAVLEDLEWPPGSAEAKEVFEHQWSLLRPALVYFMKYKDGQHTEERIREAQEWLMAYGRSAEQVRELPSPPALPMTRLTV